MMSGRRMAIFDLEHCRNRASLSLSVVPHISLYMHMYIVHFTFIDSLSLELLENLINIISATVAFLRIPSHSSGLFFIHLFRSRRLLLLFFLFGTVYVRYISWRHSSQITSTLLLLPLIVHFAVIFCESYFFAFLC